MHVELTEGRWVGGTAGRTDREAEGDWPVDAHQRGWRHASPHYWDIRTTGRWTNVLAPVARPVFSWNHDELMREGGMSLARRLGVDLVLLDPLAAVSAGTSRTMGRLGCGAGGIGDPGMAQAHLAMMSLDGRAASDWTIKYLGVAADRS